MYAFALGRAMYRLNEPLRAVCLDGPAAGSLQIVEAGRVVCVVGRAAMTGLTEVSIDGDRFALFLDDLIARGVKISAVGV